MNVSNIMNASMFNAKQNDFISIYTPTVMNTRPALCDFNKKRLSPIGEHRRKFRTEVGARLSGIESELDNHHENVVGQMRQNAEFNHHMAAQQLVAAIRREYEGQL